MFRRNDCLETAKKTLKGDRFILRSLEMCEICGMVPVFFFFLFLWLPPLSSRRSVAAPFDVPFAAPPLLLGRGGGGGDSRGRRSLL